MKSGTKKALTGGAILLLIFSFFFEEAMKQIVKVFTKSALKEPSEVEITAPSGIGTETVPTKYLDSIRNEGVEVMQKHGLSKNDELDDIIAKKEGMKKTMKEQIQKNPEFISLLDSYEISIDEYVECVVQKVIDRMTEMEEKDIAPKKGDGLSMIREFRVECINELADK